MHMHFSARWRLMWVRAIANVAEQFLYEKENTSNLIETRNVSHWEPIVRARRTRAHE